MRCRLPSFANISPVVPNGVIRHKTGMGPYVTIDWRVTIDWCVTIDWHITIDWRVTIDWHGTIGP